MHDKSSKAFNIVHVDVWWPSSMTSPNGSHYFLSFVDDSNCFQWFYISSQKNHVIHFFKHFEAFAQKAI